MKHRPKTVIDDIQLDPAAIKRSKKEEKRKYKMLVSDDDDDWGNDYEPIFDDDFTEDSFGRY